MIKHHALPFGAVLALSWMSLLHPALAQVDDPLREAISREVSVFVGSDPPAPFMETFSREVSLFVGGDPPTRYPEALSREVSLLMTTPAWPAPVSTLSVIVSPTGERVTLDWSSYNEIAQHDVLRYAIYMSSGPITNVLGMTPYTNVAAGTLSITLDNLTAWQDRYFAVVAVDALGKFNPDVTYSAAYVLAPQAISREVSLFVGSDPPSRFPETLSREVSLLMTTPDWPAPVSPLAVSVSPTGDRVTLDWSSYNEIAQNDVAYYAIYMSSGPITNVLGTTPYTNVPAGTLTLTLSNLTAWQDRYFAVVAVDALDGLNPAVSYAAAYVLAPQAMSREVSLFVGGDPPLPYRETFSREVSVLLPDAAVPAPVTNLIAVTSRGDFSAVDLDWSSYNELAQHDVVRYRIYAGWPYYTNVAGMTPRTTNVPAGTLRYTLGGLQGGANYFVAVVAEDALGNWNPTVASTLAQASQGELGDVSNLAVSCASNSLHFTWVPPTNVDVFLTHYVVYFGGVAQTLTNTATSFDAIGLEPGRGYPFRITTVDKFATESSGASVPAATPMAQPASLTTESFDGIVRLKWTHVEPNELVDHYRIYVSATNFTSVAGLTPVATNRSTRADMGGLSNGTPYFFAVSTVNISDCERPEVQTVTAIPSPQTGSYADLAIGNVASETYVLTGQQVPFSWAVTNWGLAATSARNGAAVTSWVDRIVLSPDDVFGNTNDILLAEIRRAGALGPGEGYAVRSTNQIPVTLSGYYYVFAAVDAGDEVYEGLDYGKNVGRMPQRMLVAANVPPTITQQPQSRDVESGAVVAFTVGVTGSEPMTYQWRRNGQDIPNGTNSTYVIVYAQPTNNGAYCVRIQNVGGTVVSSNALLTVTPPDTNCPALTSIHYGAQPLTNGLLVFESDAFTVIATDTSGVKLVEFYVDGTLVSGDNVASNDFTFFWNIDAVSQGPHTVAFKAFDFRDNGCLTNLTTVIVTNLPPPAPVILSPVSGTVVGEMQVRVRGTALKNTSVVLYRDRIRIGTAALAGLNGAWETVLTLVEGTNRIQAAAINRAGEGARSPEVFVKLDTTIPAPPGGVQAIARDGGRIEVQWVPGGESVLGYHVYRATTSFTNMVDAMPLTAFPTNATRYLDTPPGEGKYYYRVSTMSLAGREGPLSTEAWAVSDTNPPVALSVVYQPQTNYDAATGRFGRGFVNVTLAVNESLLTTPFFSLTPNGGTPIVVDLRPGGTNQYLGTFVIAESTPSGLANAVFSARDPAGNRGTEILSGGHIFIDTAGPDVTNLVATPAPPMRNVSNAPVLVTFTAQLSEAVRSNTLPQFSYTLSTNLPGEQPVASLTPGSNNLTWTGAFTLPPNAGVPPETLTLVYRGADDLGNASMRIVPVHQFEVYQGNLPPLEMPLGFSAKSLPAGAIELKWEAVPGAVGYQLYRKPPGQSGFAPLARTGLVVAWLDTPPVDGLCAYAVASVRQANDQESLSLSNVTSATSDRLAPGAPANLGAELVLSSAQLWWTPPTFEVGMSYNLYRANRQIDTVTNLTPWIRQIPTNQVVDSNPTPYEPYYAVAAVDRAGNISMPSNSTNLNSELVPPGVFTILLVESNPPVLTWIQTGKTNTVLGHDLYLGEQGASVKLNTAGLITTRTYTDTGYAGDNRRYTLQTVARLGLTTNLAYSVPRSLRLPRLSASLATNAIVKRGLMNRLDYTMQNDSSNAVANGQLEVVLAGRIHLSPVFDVLAGLATNIPVIVGGYSDLVADTNNLTTLTNILEIRPNEGELVSIARSGQVLVGDGQLIIGVMASEIVRGGSARVQFSLLNPGGEEVEVITAQDGNVSPEIRFTMLNADGQVLATTPFKSAVGSNIVNLPNGTAVMRVSAGAQVVSSQTMLPVPANVPSTVYIRVEIDKVYYHSDREDRVEMHGVQTRAEFYTVDTSYTGMITNVSPAISRGDQPVVISGSAQFRGTGQPAPYVPILVKIANSGFERTDRVLTDADGNFATSFAPLASEAGGVYSIWAVHPDLNDRTVQATFVIQRVLVSPASFTVRAPHGYAQPVRLSATTGPGTTVTNLHVEYRAQDQPGGTLRPGITVDPGEPIPVLGPNQTASFNLTFTGTTEAPRLGTLVLFVTSDEAGPRGWQTNNVSYEFSEAKPSLRWTPNIVDTGVAPGSNVTETVTFENVGLVSATGLRFSLMDVTGTNLAPPWASITTQTNVEELPVGGVLPVGLSFQPTNGVREGYHEFVLQSRALNSTQLNVPVFVAVVNSGRGDVDFHVLDMYSGVKQTDKETGQKYTLNGVTNALVRIQNELVAELEFSAGTDTNGQVLFTNLPAGQYKYHVTADKHHSMNGQLWIRPGATVIQQVALTYTLVSVEWEVVPITIQDRYEIVLQATFETDVPAPVVTIEPGVVNLPRLLAGDVYYGEFLVVNHGLVRADKVSFQMPASDEYVDYELLVGVPDHLEAKQRLRVPYRMVCKKSFPGADDQSAAPSARLAAALPSPGGKGQGEGALGAKATAAGGPGGGGSGCFTYTTCVFLGYEWVCINGLWFKQAVYACFHHSYGQCGGGGGGGGGVFGGGGGGGGGGGAVYSRGGQSIPGVPECFPCEPCGEEGQCDTHCCEQEEQLGNGSSGNGLCRGLNSNGPPSGGPGRAGNPPSAPAPGLRSAGARSPSAGGAKFTYTFTPRYHYDGHQAGWRLGDLSKTLSFTNDSQGIVAVTLEDVAYWAINTARTFFQYRGNRISKLDDSWRWENKSGDWELYSTNGFLLQTGHRNLLHTQMVRDGDGNVIGVDDARGQRILTFNYVGGSLSTAEDANGRQTQYAWQNGQISSTRDPAGQVTVYQYDGKGRMTRKAVGGGLALNFTYDGGGYLYSALDVAGNGKFFSYSYDKNRRAWHTTVRTTTGLVKEKVFDSSGKLVRLTENGLVKSQVIRDFRSDLIQSPTGVVTQRDYDEWGNVIREVRPDGSVWTWEYHPVFHQPVRTVDPRGAITLMAYDANGNLTEKTEAAGTVISRTNSWLYNDLNQLVRRIDRRGNAMDYTYDAAGNLVREHDPANPSYQTLYAYDLRGNRIAVTNALGHATLYGYDALDRLVAETNALGYVMLYTYTDNNLVEVETGRNGANRGRIVRYRYDDHGRRTQTLRVDDQGQEHVWETTTYDGDGKAIAVVNALGQITRYEYNALGKRTKIIRPFSATETSDTQFVYDQFGRLAQEIDPLGVITQYEYDDLDRQRKVTEALGTHVQRSRERGYDLAGNLTSMTYSDGTNAFTTFYDYDLLNRRIAVRGAREYPRQFEYDANGNLTAEINGRGYRTEFAYDSYNRRTNTVEGIGNGEPDEHAGSFEYDLVGRVVTSYDGNWNHRHYHYDTLGRQTEVSSPLAPLNTLPAGNWWLDNAVVLTRTWYNPWDQPVATSNIVGGVTATLYDAFGRRFTHTDAAGLTLTNSYNDLDQLLAIGYPVVSTAPPGSPPTSIRYAYDAYNAQMLVSTTDRANLTTRYGYDQRFHRASELSSWGALSAYRYDDLGRQTAVTNALNEVTQSVFDQLNQLVATIYADHMPVTQERIEYRAYDEFGKMTNHWGAATYDVAYAYDLAGNQVSLTDGNGNTTHWEYDGRNRKVRKIYADNSDYEYGYDANGNQTRKRDAMQRTTRYEFNAYNLLVRTDYPNDPDVTFGYDPAGRRALMVDGTGTNTWSYDAADRALTNAQFNVQHAVSYTYDAEGNRLSMTVTPLAGDDVWCTDYAYDGASRLENITDHGVSETPFHYTWATNAVRLTALTYASGLRTTYDYDVLGRKTLLSTRDNANVEIARFVYGHDKAGQRTNETTLPNTTTFEYDAKRQLRSAVVTDLSGNSTILPSFVYIYDSVGNRQFATHGETTCHFMANSLNQYTAVSNISQQILSYDHNGNLTFDHCTTYKYDDRNRLVYASNALTAATFVYDGSNRQVRQHIERCEDTDVYVYDNELFVRRTSTNLSRQYWVTRGLDYANSWQHLGGIGGELGLRSVIDIALLVSDGRGNIRLLHNGSREQQSEYEPFGKSQDMQAFEEIAGYSSKPHNEIIGIVGFSRRFLHTTLGRWLTRDPIEETGDLNLYCFLNNDPIGLNDPYGLCGVAAFPPVALDKSDGFGEGYVGGNFIGAGFANPCRKEFSPCDNYKDYAEVCFGGTHAEVHGYYTIGSSGCVSAKKAYEHEYNHWQSDIGEPYSLLSDKLNSFVRLRCISNQKAACYVQTGFKYVDAFERAAKYRVAVRECREYVNPGCTEQRGKHCSNAIALGVEADLALNAAEVAEEGCKDLPDGECRERR